MWLRTVIILLAMSILMATVVRAGDIRTVDGKVYHGDIRFMDSGKIVVVHDNQVTSLDMSDIGQMMIGDPAKLGAHGLEGQYFRDQNFTDLVGKRVDSDINFHWPAGAGPGGQVFKGITEDAYSIRWIGQIKPLYTEQYTFSTKNDDDVRMWINGQQVLESWTGGQGEASGDIALQAGERYDIKIDYVNRRSAGALELSWSSPSQQQQIVPAKCLYAPAGVGATTGDKVGNGLSARYIVIPAGVVPGAPRPQAGFRRRGGGGGRGVITRTDPTIDFTWHGPPDAAFAATDHFLVQWSGSIKPIYTGTYTFYTHCTGGVRLSVNDSPLFEDWKLDATADHTATISLVAGRRVNITMEYFDVGDPAIAMLQWSSNRLTRNVIPTACLYPDPVLTGAALQESELFDVDLPPPPQGTILSDGSVIQGVPAEVDSTGTVNLRWGKKDLSLPSAQVAIVFQDRAIASTGWTWPIDGAGGSGVVLHDGDVLQGSIQSFKDGQVQVSSIIFGFKNYPLADLQAVLFHKPVIDAAFAVHCNDGSVYMAKTLTVKGGEIAIDTGVLGPMTLPVSEVFSIKSTK